MDFDCPYTVTVLPVRTGISVKTKEEARRELGFDDSMCILSFGGSLGAGCINEVMENMIPWTVKKGLKINHIHGYGGMGRDTFPQAMAAAGVPMKSKRLRITEYINDMATCLAAADLVICRAGASTLAELEAAGKASILIPSPIVAGNHQFHNANVLGRAGAAIVIEQKNVSIEGMLRHVKKLYDEPERLAAMSARAAALQINDTPERIWDVIESLYEISAKRNAEKNVSADSSAKKEKLTFKSAVEKAKDNVMSCMPKFLPDKEDETDSNKTLEEDKNLKDSEE